jgi:heme exporter protein A
MALFEGEGLACERGGRLVFAGLGFAMQPGEALVLAGANGSGKSSLLRLMAGLLKPAAGVLRWEGKDVAGDPESFLQALQFLGHLEAVKPVLDLSENLAFWAGLRGIDPAPETLSAALLAFGLEGLADQPARYLSAGQKRRLALSRLLLGPSRLWLLDEPTVGLDAASVARLAAVIARHRAAGGCVVVATHLDLKLENARRLEMDARGGEAAA